MCHLCRVLYSSVGIPFRPGALSFSDHLKACSMSAYVSFSSREWFSSSFMHGKSWIVSFIISFLLFSMGFRYFLYVVMVGCHFICHLLGIGGVCLCVGFA